MKISVLLEWVELCQQHGRLLVFHMKSGETVHAFVDDFGQSDKKGDWLHGWRIESPLPAHGRTGKAEFFFLDKIASVEPGEKTSEDIWRALLSEGPKIAGVSAYDSPREW